MQALLIILLLLAIFLVIFTLQNPAGITVHLLFWELPQMPLVLLIAGCMAAGFLIAAIYFLPRIWKIKKEYRQMVKFNKELQELHEMNHPKKQIEPEETDPEGIELDEDEGNVPFFKD